MFARATSPHSLSFGRSTHHDVGHLRKGNPTLEDHFKKGFDIEARRITYHCLAMAHIEANLLAQGSQADSQVVNDGGAEPQEVFKVRSYQLEMLEESMKRNIIVAAETGSGKTFM